MVVEVPIDAGFRLVVFLRLVEWDFGAGVFVVVFEWGVCVLSTLFDGICVVVTMYTSAITLMLTIMEAMVAIPVVEDLWLESLWSELKKEIANRLI